MKIKVRNIVLLLVLLLAVSFVLDWGIYSIIGIAVFIYYVVIFYQTVNHSFAFREFIMLFYSLNYLFSPALMYHVFKDNQMYPMVLEESDYFSLVIPSIFLLHLGLYLIKTPIFKPDFLKMQIGAAFNKKILIFWVVAGVVLLFIFPRVNLSIAFLLFLLSWMRYVGAFALYCLDSRKNIIYPIAVLVVDVLSALQGMFNDMLTWIIFFGILWAYVQKPGTIKKIFLGLALLGFIYIVQITKVGYREKIWYEEGNTASVTLYQETAKEALTSSKKTVKQELADGFTRLNQGWILASTINNVRIRKNYQEFNLLYKYFEFVFIPRFLAPDKLRAGTGMNEIFVEYSGYYISDTTSMGLGTFADGFISFGVFGLFAMAFFTGVMFGGVFKIIELWSKIAPIYILFIFPVLIYAIRPDCETPTVWGHIFKSLIIYGAIIVLYKKYFAKVITVKKVPLKLKSLHN